jgi:hypothetical protein
MVFLKFLVPRHATTKPSVYQASPEEVLDLLESSPAVFVVLPTGDNKSFHRDDRQQQS